MNIFVNKVIFLVVMVMTIIMIIWGGFKLFIYILPFILSYLLANPLSKLVLHIHKTFKIPKGILTLILVLIVISLVFFSSGFFIYRTVLSLGDFTSHISNISENIKSLADTVDHIEIKLPWNESSVVLTEIILQFYNLILKTLSESVNETLNLVLNFLKTLPAVGLFLFFMFLSLYFFTRDYNTIHHFVKNYIEKIESPLFHSVKERAVKLVKSYLKAQLILVSVTFTISIIGLSLLGQSFSPIIALIIASVDFIPMVGPASIYVPWIIFQLVISEYSYAIALLVIYLITTLTRQVIEPKIVSSNIGTHPLITIVSMYISYRILGVIGLIIGPILIVFSLIIKHAYDEVAQKDEH